MSTHLPRLRRALLASGLATLIMTSAAHAATNRIGADVRVVDSDGKVLVDQRQYTGTTKVKTSTKADCFGEGTGGSGDKVEVPGATALGIVSDASTYQPKLSPLSITDSFSFGLGVCGFGDAIAPSTGYWYLKQDHVGSLTGGDQTIVKNGDDILWYLIEDYNDPYPAELELRAPSTVKPGEKIPVKVFEYGDDGTRTPAAGAEVGGVTTAADGTALVLPAGAGTRLIARRAGAIPSRALEICQTQKISDCPNGHVLDIDGTDGDDKIKSDRRPSLVSGYRGDDTIDLRKSTDSAPPIVSCGPGDDVVVVDEDQKYTVRKSCEKVKKS